MSELKGIAKILGFNKILLIQRFELDQRNGTLHLFVKPYKNGCRCPKCGYRGKKISSSTHTSRRWSDLNCCGSKIVLHYKPQEIRCRTHGRVQEAIPWAAVNATVTYRFEYQLLRLAAIMPQNQVASLMKVRPSTLSGILHRTIERYRSGHQIRDLKRIGIDEISYKKGHKYLTIVYDLDRACVVWMGQGKRRDTIDEFFTNALTKEQRAGIVEACCDMSEAYVGAIEDHCENANLVIDRFHVSKALNAAMDEVRKEEWRKAAGDDRRSLKGLRWLLFKHHSNRTKGDTRKLNQLKRANRRIHRAWVLKDEFNLVWEYSYRGSAEKSLKGWCTSALRSRLEPLRKFVATVRRHQDRILGFIGNGTTNAIAEGINRVIRQMKNWASGFRNIDHFMNLIFLRKGDLDIAEQIAPTHQIW